MKSVIPFILWQLTCLFLVTARDLNKSQITKSRLTKSEKLIKTNDILHANDHYYTHTSSHDDHNDHKESSENRLSPIILLPGDGGSRLQARLNRRDVSHKYCERKTNDWFDLWLNLSLLVPFALECWVDNMRLIYNSTTRSSMSPPGVETRVGGFGLTESVEYVDPSKVRGSNYFDTLVRQLVNLGYERNKNILGAPYDFRRAPNELQEYFTNLEALIERSFRDNGNERVVLICHSMGCLNALHFLNTKTQAWKDKYIRSMISLSGVWGGSVKALKAFASGDNFGVVVIPTLSLRKDVRTFPSLAYLLPSKDVWPKDQVLVKNHQKKYTVNDYHQFFQDINYPIGYDMWLDVHNLTSPLVAPGVEVHCLHGNKVTTMEMLDYEVGEFPDAKPKLLNGDGDGTVNLVSLQACRQWSLKQKEPLHYRNFTGVDHMNILVDDKVLDYIGDALSKNFN